jgi:hypothetical protein
MRSNIAKVFLDLWQPFSQMFSICSIWMSTISQTKLKNETNSIRFLQQAIAKQLSFALPMRSIFEQVHVIHKDQEQLKGYNEFHTVTRSPKLRFNNFLKMAVSNEKDELNVRKLNHQWFQIYDKILEQVDK